MPTTVFGYLPQQIALLLGVLVSLPIIGIWLYASYETDYTQIIKWAKWYFLLSKEKP